MKKKSFRHPERSEGSSISRFFARLRLLRMTSLFLFLFISGGMAHADESRLLPIQQGGRVKTFDAFSRETLTLVHGRSSWEKRPALAWFLDALAKPEAVRGWKWVRVDYEPLKQSLGLDPVRRDFSYDEIFPLTDKLESLGRSAEKKRNADSAPSLLERKAESLYQALGAVQSVINQEAFRMIPPAQGSADPSWRTLRDSSPEAVRPLQEIAEAHQRRDSAAFDQKVNHWLQAVGQSTGHRYDRVLGLESFYLVLRPFGLGAAAYLAGFLLLLTKRFKKWGAALAVAGFLLHTTGLSLRVLILGRPPVSNMYESMVWMNWVLMLAALILSWIRRDLAAITVGAVASAVVMLYGDLLPIDSGFEMLVPVLRSNYWLSIHVLTIVSSYGLFGLAMGLGHRHLWLHQRGRWGRGGEQKSAQLIYRAIQVGVLLLGIGTTLGGVWANESWGRFWGWDPKETWALITFLGYLVLIHLHFARIVKPFSLAVSAILGFLLVLFTWYGVNFVLGRGLHSYGQGSGGMSWILLYLGIEALFLTWVFCGRVIKGK